MTLNITIPNNINDTKPKISVIGIGGWCNIVVVEES